MSRLITLGAQVLSRAVEARSSGGGGGGGHVRSSGGGFKWFGSGFLKVIEGNAGNLLKVIGLHMQRDIVLSFSPMAPSKPGQPPAVVTGNLRSNVVWELNNGSNSQNAGPGEGATALAVGVTSRAFYGGILEVKMNRPFLVPALRRMMGQLPVERS